MTKHYAFIKNGIVDNISVFEDTATDEFAASFLEIMSADTCAEILDYENSGVQVGYSYNGIKFIPAKNYPSWIYQENTNSWVAPVARPKKGIWVWNEDALEWIEFQPQ